MKTEIELKIRGLMECQLGHVGMALDDELSMIGMDSLDELEMIMVIEEEFNIEIPDEDLKAWETLNDAIGYINNRA